MTFEPTICLSQKVEHITKEDDYFIITTNTGVSHYSKSVIVAIGGGIFKPIKLELEESGAYEMSNLHYTINGIEQFKGKDVLISGGGNSAIDWAVELLPVAKKLTVIYRSEELKAHESQIKKLVEQGIEIKLNTEMTKLVSNEHKTEIERVVINENGTVYEMKIDELLVCHGYNHEISLDFSKSIEPVRNEYNQINSEGQCKTSIPGIYAAGDIVAYEDKVYLLVGAFNDAVLAVNSAKKYIEPNASSYAIVSSQNEKFEERNRELFGK